MLKSMASISMRTVILLSLLILSFNSCHGKRRRIAKRNGVDNFRISNRPTDKEVQDRLVSDGAFIWSQTRVAVGDTAVLYCSFDAIYSKLRDANIAWEKATHSNKSSYEKVATGRTVLIDQRRFKVYRPHAGALSVLLVRRVKKHDAGIYRCDLDGSKTKRKYMVLNVTESKINASTSPTHLKTQRGRRVDLWCNGTGYPRPMVYWSREGGKPLPDGRLQHWGNHLHLDAAKFKDSGIYACYLENFVQPVVSYKFNLVVEDKPWKLMARKMKFDGLVWYSYSNKKIQPKVDSSFLLMCKTKGLPIPMPAITWYKDGIRLSNNNDYFIIEDVNTWSTAYISSTLVMMNFSPEQGGNYTCIARNIYRHHRKLFLVEAIKVADDTTLEPTVVTPAIGISTATTTTTTTTTITTTTPTDANTVT